MSLGVVVILQYLADAIKYEYLTAWRNYGWKSCKHLETVGVISQI